MVDDDLPLIKNIKVSDTPLGISTKDIVLRKFVNGEEQLPVSIKNTTSSTLSFNLTIGEVGVGTEKNKIKYSRLKTLSNPLNLSLLYHKRTSLYPQIVRFS